MRPPHAEREVYDRHILSCLNAPACYWFYRGFQTEGERMIKRWRLLGPIAALAAVALHPAGASARPDDPYITIARDAGAGGYEAFPDVCRTRNGQLLCVFYAGFAHVSLPSYGPKGQMHPKAPNGGRICLIRSLDNGRTWSAPAVILDTPRDDRDPSIAALPDGTLLCNYFSHRPGRGGAGYQFVHTAIIRSTDGGRSWSPEQPLFNKWACSSPVRLLRDGRLAMALYYVGSSGGEDGWGGVSFSSDKGHTWAEPVAIGKGSRMKFDAEPDIIELPDGRLLAGLRPAPGERSMAFCWSTDGGRSWSAPQPTGFPAHSIYFLLTSKNVLLMGHRIPGTSLHYSLDFGKTWSANVLLAEASGAYPSMVELPDGSIYTVLYEEGPQADILALRFRVDRDAPNVITILPPAEWK